MTLPTLQALAQTFTERQLNTAAVGILLAFLVWVSLRIASRQNSGTRFAIWSSTLLAIVGLPFLSFFHASPALHAAHFHREIILTASWASYLFAAWGAVTILLFVRLAMGLWRVHIIRKNCTEVDLGRLDPLVAEILQTSAARRVRLCTSNELTVPAAIGLFRPAIVFPAQLLPQLSAHEIEVTVRHELAHLNRWDDWTNLAQKIVKAVFFFHPAVWWIENRLTLEREMACDDIVLAQTESPKAYASSLISFAEKLQSARGLSLAQALVSRMHQMSLRVTQILDAKRPRRIGIWKPALGMSFGLLVVVFGAAPYMPRLVAFEQPGHAIDAAQYTTAASGRAHNSNGDFVLGNASVQPAQWRGLGPQPKAISASFKTQPRVTRSLKTQVKTGGVGAKDVQTKTSSIPLVLRTAADQPQPAAQPIYVLRTTEYEVSTSDGQAIWTLCIWRVDENNPADRQLESAIVVSLI